MIGVLYTFRTGKFDEQSVRKIAETSRARLMTEYLDYFQSFNGQFGSARPQHSTFGTQRGSRGLFL